MTKIKNNINTLKMAYKKITAVTFDVLNQMSEYLYQNQNQKQYSEIQKKVADYLVTNGEKKFVEVFMGSRGCLEEVKVVESDLTLKEFYNDLVEEIVDGMKEDCEDEEDLEFMTEFVGVEDFEGFSVVGLNEEESLVVFDFELNEDLCEKILELYDNDDEFEIRKIIDSLEYVK